MPSMPRSSVARGRVDLARRRRPRRRIRGVVEVITPANRPAAGAGPRRQAGHVQLPHRGAAERPASAMPASRSRSSSPRRSKPRPRARACLAPTYEAEPARVGFDGGEPYDAASRRHRLAGRVREGRHRSRARRSGASDRGGLRDAGPVPQRDGAARHRRQLGRRPPDARHAQPGDRDGAGRASPPSSASRPRTCRLRSPFLGGGFGSKAILAGPQILCILAARMLGRPVKLVLHPRADVRPRRPSRRDPADAAARHRRGGPSDRAGAPRDICATSSFDDFLEPAANASHNTYATPAIATAITAPSASTPARLDRCARRARPRARPRSSAPWTRRPRRCGLDPLEFRLQELRRDRPGERPALLGKGAARMLRPRRRAVRLGRPAAGAPRRCATTPGRLVGWGMGTALFPAPMFPAEARAVLRRDGTALSSRPRPPTWARARGRRWRSSPPTALGLDIDQVEFRSGSSELPDAGVAGGSGHTASAGRRHSRRRRRRDRAARRPRDQPTPTRRSSAPAMPGSRRATGACTAATTPSRSESYAEILARAGLAELEGTGKGGRDPAPPRPTRCSRTARSSPRSRSIPSSGRSASAAWSAPSPPAGSSIRGWPRASSRAA